MFDPQFENVTQTKNIYTFVQLKMAEKTDWTQANSMMMHCIQANEWMNKRTHPDGVVRSLTGHSVDCFERPEDPHCSDGCQVDILQVQRVFNHPGETHRSSPSASWTLQHPYSFTNCGCLAPRSNFPHLCSHLSFNLLLWLHLEALVGWTPPFILLQKHTRSDRIGALLRNQ